MLNAEWYILGEERLLFHISIPKKRRVKHPSGVIQQLYVPETFQYDILTAYHDDLGEGHIGVNALFLAISE